MMSIYFLQIAKFKKYKLKKEVYIYKEKKQVNKS